MIGVMLACSAASHAELKQLALSDGVSLIVSKNVIPCANADLQCARQMIAGEWLKMACEMVQSSKCAHLCAANKCLPM